MTSPITSVQGLASGIKWQDIIDQLIAVDTSNQLDPVKARADAQTKSMTAWSSYGSLASALQLSAKGLADGSAFSSVAISAPNSGVTSRTLLTATAATGAATGTYGVQVLGLATAQQLSGNIVADASAALGVSGQFIVGGKAVTLAATDSLNSLRDKINALNIGSTPSHVSASILFTGSSNVRLVLTSDIGGASGVDLRDVRTTASDPSVLTQLGLIDGTTSNVGSDGAVRSATFASSSQKVAAMALGVSVYPAPATININGRTITIDLQNQSLANIAAMINAQTPNAASVETVTTDSGPTYRLRISGSVTTTADPGSQPVLDLLGLTRGTTGVVKQQVSTSNVLQDDSGVTATSSSLLAGLKLAGGMGALSGDTFTIAGTKADGVTPVSLTQTVDGTTTVGDFLARISTAFSSSANPVTASIVNGTIQLKDETGGDSGLSFSISTDNAGGGTLGFGSTSVTTVGRERELAQGADARLLVNGVLMTRSSNNITDAIGGVTLNLQQAEIGTTIPVTVSRDTGNAVKALQSFASAYNAVQSFVTTSTASGGDLAFNGAVRQSFNSIKTALLTSVTGIAPGSAFSSAALVGVALDKTGKLTIDTTVLGDALNKNSDAVKALFQTNGVTTSADFSYVSSGNKSTAGAYAVNVTAPSTRPSVASSTNNFVYAGTTGDTMTLADSLSGKSGSISLEVGDTPDTVAAKLNTMFQAQGVRLSASNASGALTITGADYGSRPSFTTSYSSSNVATLLGIAAGTTRNGQDIQGTFFDGVNSYAATGDGQVLTGATGTPVDGLAMMYKGIAASSGHLDFAVGVAGLANRITDQISNADGIATQQQVTLQASINALATRQTDIQSSLAAQRAALTAQFTAMESALSKIQAQGQWLTQQINAMNSLQSSGS
jgi:flagellar hook-associated protein 2